MEKWQHKKVWIKSQFYSSSLRVTVCSYGLFFLGEGDQKKMKIQFKVQFLSCPDHVLDVVCAYSVSILFSWKKKIDDTQLKTRPCMSGRGLRLRLIFDFFSRQGLFVFGRRPTRIYICYVYIEYMYISLYIHTKICIGQTWKDLGSRGVGSRRRIARATPFEYVFFFWNTLQHAAMHCSTLQHNVVDEELQEQHRLSTFFFNLEHTATHCSTLQHTSTRCNILQHTATHRALVHSFFDVHRALNVYARILAFFFPTHTDGPS